MYQSFVTVKTNIYHLKTGLKTLCIDAKSFLRTKDFQILQRQPNNNMYTLSEVAGGFG